VQLSHSELGRNATAHVTAMQIVIVVLLLSFDNVLAPRCTGFDVQLIPQ